MTAVDPKDSVGMLDQHSFDVYFFTEMNAMAVIWKSCAPARRKSNSLYLYLLSQLPSELFPDQESRCLDDGGMTLTNDSKLTEQMCMLHT